MPITEPIRFTQPFCARLREDLSSVVSEHNKRLDVNKIQSRFLTNQLGLPQAMLDQIPLVGQNLSVQQAQTIGKVQEAIPLIRIVNRLGDVIGSGSAVCVNQSGLFVTAFHVAQRSIDSSEAKSFSITLDNELLRELIENSTQDIKLFIDIPRLSSTEDGIEITTLPIVVLDYDSEHDIALLSIDKSQKANLQAIPLETSSVKLDSLAYKIGHIAHAPYNLLSQGKVVRTGLDQATMLNLYDFSPGPYKDEIFTSTGAGPGDSGGAVINENGNVVAIPLYVLYQCCKLHKTMNEIVLDPTLSPGSYSMALQHEQYLGSANIQKHVLPYLERVLGGKNFKKLIDGDELSVTSKEITRTKSNRPKYFVIGLGSMPFSSVGPDRDPKDIKALGAEDDTPPIDDILSILFGQGKRPPSDKA